MKPILYVETNFAIGVAKGHDQAGQQILDGSEPWLSIGFPTVCFLEAFGVLNFETKQWNIFRDALESKKREYGRNERDPVAKHLVTHLSEAVLCGEQQRNTLEIALHDVLDVLSEHAELLELDYHTIQHALSEEQPEDPTDNLILSTILAHAHRPGFGPKAFVSGNTKDFDSREVQGRIRKHFGDPNAKSPGDSTRFKFFARTESALGWLRSQAIPDDPTRPDDFDSDPGPGPDPLAFPAE